MKGGARNRSGPAPDPSSFRSEARGLALKPLPAEGWRGDVPAHPDPRVEGRELDLWLSLWRTPQAAAWVKQPWRWSHVADLARLMALVEDPETPVGAYTHLRQARADLGLTPAGLIENGWSIVADELEDRREGREEAKPSAVSARDRMKALNA